MDLVRDWPLRKSHTRGQMHGACDEPSATDQSGVQKPKLLPERSRVARRLQPTTAEGSQHDNPVTDEGGDRRDAPVSRLFYNRIRDGLMPRPVKVGERLSAWPDHEIEAINAATIAGKSRDDIRALVADLEARAPRNPRNERPPLHGQQSDGQSALRVRHE